MAGAGEKPGSLCYTLPAINLNRPLLKQNLPFLLFCTTGSCMKGRNKKQPHIPPAGFAAAAEARDSWTWQEHQERFAR